LVLVDNPPHHLSGDYGLTEAGYVSAVQKPYFNFGGIGVYHPQIFKSYAVGQALPWRVPLLPLITAGKITGEHYKGIWHNVGTVSQWEVLQ
jgi:MurNAc alpha-1-phosphate uridylyltransferase